MTLREHLNQFYKKYNIPPEGGIDDKTFEVPLPFFTLRLPNFPWRRRMLYVHDLEHILNEQDTTWPGEIFIASWEISTGFFKNFPVILFPLWTMGWGIWVCPSAVWRGFSKGNSDRGIARLPIDKDQILELNLAHLQSLTLNKRSGRSPVFLYLKLAAWTLISQLVFFFPVVLLLLIFASV